MQDKTQIYNFNIRLINILAAFLISVFVVFPDIVREFDNEDPAWKPGFRKELNQTPPGFEKTPPGDYRNKKRPPNVHPQKNIAFLFIDFVFYFLFSFSLLLINTTRRFNLKWIINKKNTLIISILYTIIYSFIAFIALFFISEAFRGGPRLGLFFINGMLLFKFLFVALTSVLFGHVLRLINTQQEIVIENERLRAENLQNRFDVLSSQINPHFFFNSLNSLSSLIRESKFKDSLEYINKLSDIFRYVLKRNWQEKVTLEEELRIFEAFRFMLEIRYQGKLFFDISIDETIKRKFVLPALSIQPLIENAVKHNVISSNKPLTIKLHITENHELKISNNIQNKLEEYTKTGIGLENLENRFRLLMNKSITISNEKGVFSVKLPMQIVE